MGAEGLPHGEHLVLRFIANSASRGGNRFEKVRAAMLLDTLDISRPAISRILNAPESKGFVTRSIDKADRRGVSAEITDKGLRELKRSTGSRLEKAERIAANSGKDETETLIRILDRLSEILSDAFLRFDGRLFVCNAMEVVND